jgi:hypothetical protein
MSEQMVRWPVTTSWSAGTFATRVAVAEGAADDADDEGVAADEGVAEGALVGEAVALLPVQAPATMTAAASTPTTRSRT